MATLIRSNGALDRQAILAEIDARLAAMLDRWRSLGWDECRISRQYASYGPIVTAWVEREARIEQRDVFEATMRRLTTDAERARMTELRQRANSQPINGDGNQAFREIYAEHDRIDSGIRKRVEAFLAA